MRVIAGTYKGRTLQAPKGILTRPTTDRVRESLFSTLASQRGGMEGAIVLDAFAGSGALGVEALSRGARFASFCEKDRHALESLQANTSFLTSDSFTINRIDIDKRLPTIPPAAFNLVFLDPPYARSFDQTARFLVRLDEAGMLARDAIVSFEHARGQDPAASTLWNNLQLTCVSEKTYGQGAIHIYRKEAN